MAEIRTGQLSRALSPAELKRRRSIDPSAYLGLSYQAGGRQRPAVDCWGLVCLVYRECLQLELPAYDQVDQVGRAIVAERLAWHELAPAGVLPGDVVLARRLGRPFHVGIMLAGWRVLHCDDGANVTAPRLDGPACRGWHCQFWRHP